MVVEGELFTIDELGQLSLIQLQRVCAYLGVEFTIGMKPAQLRTRIIEFQKPRYESNWDGNPDWQPGTGRSARVQRLYELNVLGKKL